MQVIRSQKISNYYLIIKKATDHSCGAEKKE